jgi:DNA-binding IclR family transcriptional regulator
MTTQSKARLGIQSVEVAGRILAALVKAGRPAALKDLARLAGMPPGKAHRYLVSLVRIQLVSQEAISGNYGIGPMAITLGLTGLRGVEVVRTALELMPTLRDEIDETVMLIIWGSHGPVVHAFEESSRPVFMNVRVGSTVPMLLTAAGRLFAAYLPVKQTRDIVEAERRALVAAGREPPSESDWARQLEETRRAGLASVAGDLLPGVNAIAAPIFDHKGRIAAIIGALGRGEEMNVAFDGPAAVAVKRAAAEISRRIGYLG